MNRKIYDKLLEWKQNRQGKTAVLVEGARRVGKSYIVKKFAEENYKSYILLDFNNVSEEVKDLFYNNLSDLNQFFQYLTILTGTELFERESIIIFDEVQMFPKARSAIKYLVEDGRYDYVETGSLVSIKENVQDIVIPSEEERISLNPMDFEEYLLATNQKDLISTIKNAYNELESLPNSIHRKAMEAFREYVIVGGMPQAVETYIKTKDFNEVDRVKRNILNLYRDDIAKNAPRYSLKVRNIFDTIPSELQKNEKKFSLSSLDKNARLRDYEEAIFWLVDADIVNPCFKATEPNIGLKLNTDISSFKIYMADTGLLISHAFDENGLVKEEVYKKILLDKLEFNAGMIIENVVAQMLKASGHKLYFYSSYDRNNSDDNIEIDFLIQKPKITSRNNISPIEVKSGKNYTTVSLNKFKDKYKGRLNKSYIIHPSNLKVEEDVIYLPIYMTMFL